MSGKNRTRADSPDYQKRLEKALQRARNVPLAPSMGAIAFFEMPGYTKMMKRGSRTAVPVILGHNYMCRVIIESNGGKIVKELGDGLMVRFTNIGKALACAVLVIRNLRKHGGGISTKATIAFGTLWNIKNASGHRDVHGTPVRVSSRMTAHAVKNAILIDGSDKESVIEWLEWTSFAMRRLRKKLKDYPDKELYIIYVK